MKKIALFFAMAALACHAQTNISTNAAVTTIDGAIGNVLSWVQTINPSNNFSTTLFWDGPVYQNGVNVANEAGMSVDLWHSASATNNNGTLFFAVESRTRQAGIAGTFLSEQGGLEFGYEKHDFRAGGYADYVYLNNAAAVDIAQHSAYEIGLFADKMMSSVSAVGLFIGYQEHSKYPLLGANLTVTFGGGNGLFGLF